MLDAFAALDASQDFRLLLLPLGRNEPHNRLVDHLPGGIAKKPFRPGIPTGDDAAQILANDGVVRECHNGAQLGRRRLGVFALRNIGAINTQPLCFWNVINGLRVENPARHDLSLNRFVVPLEQCPGHFRQTFQPGMSQPLDFQAGEEADGGRVYVVNDT
jgi:hypothetical protein